MEACLPLWKSPAIFAAEKPVAACGFLSGTAWAGNNRVSLSVTLFQNGDEGIHLSAITSGGSQAVFFKINTWGEEAFLRSSRNCSE